MFRYVDLNDFIINVTPDGWYQIDMDYFDNHPEVCSIVQAMLKSSPTATKTIETRYLNLNKIGRTAAQCPRKGVAVRKPSNQFYTSWLDTLVSLFKKHYPDVTGGEISEDASACEINHYVTGMHERFQLPKMGMFAPYEKGSMTKSVSKFIKANKENNQQHMSVENAKLAVEAMIKMRNTDLVDISDGSLSVCSARDAVYGSNVQGLATGLVQRSRDLTLTEQHFQELEQVYGCSLTRGLTVAETILELHEKSDLGNITHFNTVTNLKRVQVGGLDIDIDDLPPKISVGMFKDAKYRTISANDPLVQVVSAMSAIPFRDAVKTKTEGIFYNTLFDPDGEWDRLEAMVMNGIQSGDTLFPFDYKEHDAKLHAEWMFNLYMHVIKPKFCEQDQPIIDFAAIASVYKLYLQPYGKRQVKLTPVVGSLGSGEPWTNGLGTCGTRTVGHILADSRPDIFSCYPGLGCNNGDDCLYGVKKNAIETFGIEYIIKVANDIVNQFNYYFNEAKLICIRIPGNNYVGHWEQYAIWYNQISNEVLRHGSTLRYFGKIYSDEDAGRQNAVLGLIDQLSTINNTLGYVGDQTFTTTTLNLDVLAQFIKNDSLLTSYIDKHGEAFFSVLVNDAVEIELKKSKLNGNARDEASAKKEAEDKILHSLRAAGFDKSDMHRVIHDRDFSFHAASKLVGLGSAELARIAECGLGELLLFRISDGRIEWLDRS